MAYIGNKPGSYSQIETVETRERITAGAGQTDFATLGYEPSHLKVYLNGVLLDPADYTAIDGVNIILAAAADVNDELTYISERVWTPSLKLTDSELGNIVYGSSEKTIPVDADVLSLSDSAASWKLKKFSWANLKATAKTYFDTLYQAIDAYTAKLNVIQTWTAKQIFGDTVKLDEVIERITLTDTAPPVAFDATAQGIVYHKTNTPSGNWTQNISNVNANMAAGESLTVTLLVTQGATGYLPTLNIDGTATGVTVKVLGGTAWTPDASCTNAFTYSIIKTANATFTVLASKSKYA